MNSQYTTNFQSIEKYWGFPIPKPYQQILMNVIENELFEYIGYEPNYLMIGQDGDLGYFISNIHSDLNLYGLDLGALGSLPFGVITSDYQTLFN